MTRPREGFQESEAKAPLARDGLPRDGSYHGGRRVVRVRSAGPGVPVRVRNRIGRTIRRVSGWRSDDSVSFDHASSDRRSFIVTPTSIEEGQELVLLIE